MFHWQLDPASSGQTYQAKQKVYPVSNNNNKKKKIRNVRWKETKDQR